MKKLVGFYLSFILFVFWAQWPLIQAINSYRLTFLNIGQGDSVLIQTPENCRVLIDSGKPNQLKDNLINILPFNTRHIDMIIITHPDLDHYGGFIDLPSKYKISLALLSPHHKSNSSYKKLISQLEENKVITHKITNHYSTEFCRLKINFTSFSSDSANGASIVTHVYFPTGHSVFLGGDIEKEQEHQLLLSNFPLNSDIYKSSHHGSSTSNSHEILQKIRPNYMVIQSGLHNSYGNPHLSTLRDAFQEDIKVLRNDLQGQIDFFFSNHRHIPKQRLVLELKK